MKTIRSTPGKHLCRAGVTLTEVLMSLMIMSIGVASVATLFPISALRSAQATRMTNAAIMKYNIEAEIKARPELVFDPDGDFLSSSVPNPDRITEHFRSDSERNYVIDPAGYFAAATRLRFDNGQPLVGLAFGSVDDNAGDVDAVPAGARGFADYFGNTGTALGGEYAVLPRYDGGIRARAAVPPSPFTLSATTIQDFDLLASATSSLGDTWDTIFDTNCDGFIALDGSFSANTVPTANMVGVRLPDDFDLGGLVSSRQYAATLQIPDPELTRITVFNANGRKSQTFALTGISGQDCFWTEAAVGSLLAAADVNRDFIVSSRRLPVEFGGLVGRVLIQTKRTQDFTWVLTVRRGADGRASGVDVVVLFTGSRSPIAERVFAANFVNGAFGVVVAKTSGTDTSGDAVEPTLRRGGWVLDVENARWYRVSNFETNPANANQYLVTLETAANASSPGGIGGAIFLNGVVDVYPLGSIPLPASMSVPNF